MSPFFWDRLGFLHKEFFQCAKFIAADFSRPFVDVIHTQPWLSKPTLTKLHSSDW